MPSSLPVPSKLQWSHATNSLDKVKSALSNNEITAIEADIMMGYYTDGGGSCRQYGPIMSHPPYEESDLSAALFLQLAMDGGAEDLTTNAKDTGTCTLTANVLGTPATRSTDSRPIRHIKLDFKQIEAVGPVMDIIQSTHRPRYGQTIFLNADVLPGPGVRGHSAVTVQAKQFIETCFQYIDETPDEYATNFAFSLGYKADYRSGEAYTKRDVTMMSEIVSQYNIESRCGGVVLALNARTLALDPTVFDVFLSTYANAQILAWTGAGEPPIPKASIDAVKRHFGSTDTIARIGFDCDVEYS